MDCFHSFVGVCVCVLGWCASRNSNVTLVAAGVGLACLWNGCEHKYVCDGATINALAFEHIIGRFACACCKATNGTSSVHTSNWYDASFYYLRDWDWIHFYQLPPLSRPPPPPPNNQNQPNSTHCRTWKEEIAKRSHDILDLILEELIGLYGVRIERMFPCWLRATSQPPSEHTHTQDSASMLSELSLQTID